MSKVYLTFEDMQNCPAADDVDSADIVLSADGCDGPMRWCPENQDWFPFKQFVLDLSPLQKFMGRPRKSFWAPTNPVKGMVWIATGCPGPGPAEQPHQWDGERWVCMYGMDYDFDWVPPAPSPEKSPQEKALDDFIAKRKAKREGAGVFGGIGRDAEDAEMRRAIKEEADGRILDRAMRRLSFHEQDIHTRLMPYRREE